MWDQTREGRRSHGKTEKKTEKEEKLRHFQSASSCARARRRQYLARQRDHAAPHRGQRRLPRRRKAGKCRLRRKPAGARRAASHAESQFPAADPASKAERDRHPLHRQSAEQSGGTKASSHFIIGIDGEIVQCIPSSEIAYASNSRNDDTLSIECCHPDESGKFSEETYDSLVELTAWLCRYFDISPDEVIRHYDVTGKLCPKYYVENEDAWEDLLADIKEAYDAM